MRIGFGYDVHRLVEGRKLVLGGIDIPSSKGLEGHSDADILLHAVCDALLGAMGEGDIGRHFPNSDPRFRGISSLELLKRVAARMAELGMAVENLDSTVILEEPMIGPYIPRMKEQIAAILEISGSQVNVKATTSEGLGFVGGGQGACAHAVALLKTRDSKSR